MIQGDRVVFKFADKFAVCSNYMYFLECSFCCVVIVIVLLVYIVTMS